MKRAKRPPPTDLIEEATIFADIIEVGRRPELELGRPGRIEEITQLAMAEYLRRFPKARKMNNDPFVLAPQIQDGRSTRETDIQCMFCRKSLNTIASHRVLMVKSPMMRKVLDHTEHCGIRMLAGLMIPNAPVAYGEPGL